MGGHSSKLSDKVPAVPTTQQVANTEGAKAKLSNLLRYMTLRIGERTSGGVVAAAGKLAAVCEANGFDDLVRVIDIGNQGLGTFSSPMGGPDTISDSMPYAVVRLLNKGDDYTDAMNRMSAAESASRSIEPVVADAVAHQMVGWFDEGDPSAVATYSAVGARILSQVFQEFPAANANRNNVFIVRLFNKQPLTANFLSFGWMLEEADYHISIQGGGSKASVSGDGKVLTLPITEIAREALVLACFAEDTLVKGIGWCTACDPSGATLDASQVEAALSDFTAKLDAASQPIKVDDADSHAMNVFKFQCPSMSITPGEAISLSNQACRSIGVLVRRPSASGAKTAQYYVMVEGGAYFLTAAILKVAAEEGAALNWCWPDSKIPIIPAGIYDKPYVYGAVSQEMESRSLSGMDQVLALMQQMSEPCQPIGSQAIILQMAKTLFEKGFTVGEVPYSVADSEDNSLLLAQDKSDLLAPAVQSAMKSLITSPPTTPAVSSLT